MAPGHSDGNGRVGSSLCLLTPSPNPPPSKAAEKDTCESATEPDF